MDLGTAITDLQEDNWLAEATSSRWWGCNLCRNPDVLTARMVAGVVVEKTFRCSVNMYAPFANSSMCKSFEQVPGIEDLWT